MPRVKQLTVSLENKPGKLAHLTSTLSNVGINILAISVPETPRGKRGKVRLLVSDETKAKEALATAKIRFADEEAILLILDNQPGGLSRIASKLGEAKINIKYAYATTQEGYNTASLILVPSDIEKAVSVIGEM